ncbi:MAG: AlpA family phage regulatory protein [Mesorhizobium sp.]|nr:AlpA family phage regulatory protein [Mesorhizobium sp. M4A.F.Ca.ET.090.04.2.1]TIW64057.1 MAG: AlpA family phage regulatory protein [Mesorhizobium sp.]
MKLKDVMKMTSLGSSTIYRKLADSSFPQPLALSPSCVRWRQSDVLAWIRSLHPERIADRAA